MTPDTQQARVGQRRLQVRQADSETAIRSGGLSAGAARTVIPGGDDPPVSSHPGVIADDARPAPASRQTRAAARRARKDTSIVRVIPFLAVVVVTVAGVYIAWQKGSTGGGEGGVVGGAALLAAAVARLLLPARLVGLLAVRRRAVDVITLTAFGACLLAAGLVMPR